MTRTLTVLTSETSVSVVNKPPTLLLANPAQTKGHLRKCSIGIEQRLGFSVVKSSDDTLFAEALDQETIRCRVLDTGGLRVAANPATIRAVAATHQLPLQELRIAENDDFEDVFLTFTVEDAWLKTEE